MARFTSKSLRTSRRQEHWPTLALSAFWFWIMLCVLSCGCIALFNNFVPMFPRRTAAPPFEQPTEPPLADPSEPAATLTPPPSGDPAVVMGIVTDQRVNLRAAPSTDADVVGEVERNNRVILVGRSEDGQWFQVNSSETQKAAWIMRDTLTVEGGDPDGLPVITSP